jgi:uncharacterized delta-60 repeat protein
MQKLILFIITIFTCCCTTSYSQPGILDPSFANKGIVNTDFGAAAQIFSVVAHQVLIQPDGAMNVILATRGRITITRLLADGTIDSSYGENGYSQSVSGQNAKGVLQSDGKIVVASGSRFTLVRYNIDGTLDTTFSRDGKQTTDFGSRVDVARSVVIQTDGKIVVAGYTNTYGSVYFEYNDIAVARYNSDGTLDTTFSEDGKQTTHFESGGAVASSLAIQSNGKIVVAGYTNGSNRYVYDFALARYNTDGSLDTTFSDDGKQSTDFSLRDDYIETVAIQSDGKMVVSGGTFTGINSDFALARYNTDGTLDKTFSEDGKQTTDFNPANDYYDNAYSMTIQRDGKIILAGYNLNDFALARYDPDGSLDTSFSVDGKQTTDFGYGYENATSVALQADGKIVVVGGSLTGDSDIYNFSFARYNADGSIDNTFSEDGKITDYVHVGNTVYTSTAIQADGKIVVAGSAEDSSSTVFAIARYNTDGTLDTSFSADGKQTTDFDLIGDVAKSLALQNDGKIVVVGLPIPKVIMPMILLWPATILTVPLILLFQKMESKVLLLHLAHRLLLTL